MVFLFWMLVVSFSVDAKTFPEIKGIKNDVYARFLDFNPKFAHPSTIIVDIEQDRYGYIWLAGTDGLYRFDGNKIRHFINDWTPGALPSTMVYALCNDAYGRLWAGTRNGLCYYDYKMDEFVKVLVTNPGSNLSDSLFVRKLLNDGDSILWVDTHQGYLYKIDLGSLEIKNFYKHSKGNQPYYYYHALYKVGSDVLWLGGRGNGPHKLNLKTGTFEYFGSSNYKSVPGKKRGNDVSYYHIDKKGNFWIGSTDGIYVLDTDRGYFHLFYQTSSWTMLEDSQGNLWFGVSGGLVKYNIDNQLMVFYEPNEEDKQSLSGNYIYEIFEDDYHQIWISSAKGVSVLKQGSEGIKYYFHIPGIDQTLISSSVSAMVKDQSGVVWIGTTSSGVDRFDPYKEEFIHYNHKNTKGLPSDHVRNLHVSPDGKIFLSLWAGVGFGMLHPKNRLFSLFSYDPKSTQYDWYNDMVFDKKGDIYLGFWGAHGLTKFNLKTKSMQESFQNKFFKPYESRLITSLAKDKNNHLWMGTTTAGLHLFLPEEDTSVCFLKELNPSGIEESMIYDIETDVEGNVWVGAKGLYFGNSDLLSINPVDLGSKYKNIQIYGLFPEDTLSVWLMTDLGLLKFHRKEQSIINYSPAVHLIFKENNASAAKLNDGRMMFGGDNGLVLIDPSEIKLGYDVPKIFLSSLLVFDKLKTPNLSGTDKIQLSHNENFFRIQIGSNLWGQHIPFRFYYKLEGFNKAWVEISSSDMEARFTNVPPGEYNFHIRAEDVQGNKYPNLVECSIVITPPFWKRLWFIVLFFMAIFLVLYFMWWNRMKNLKLSLFNLDLNQKLLRAQMNPHFFFNALSAIQSYIYSSEPHKAGEYLSDFAHLFRRILKNSRKDSISISEELETVELYMKLQQLRFNEQFVYRIIVDPKLLDENYSVPPMILQPFLENAIEHGIKNIQYLGEISIDYQLRRNVIRCVVKDNGIGITASKQLNEAKGTNHESVALSIVKTRLEILSKKQKVPVTFSVEEIKDFAGNIKGTIVIFDIPIYQ